MTATSKWSLISESIAVIQSGVHPAGEEPDQHAERVVPWDSRMTIVCKVPTKLKSGPALRMKSWPLAIVQPGHHLRLPHSPSNKPPRSKEVRFDKVVTKLLGLLGPIKPDMRSVEIKIVHRDQNDMVLNRHGRGLPPWNLRIFTVCSLPFPSVCSTFLYLPCPITPTE
jgi:hypothetical protein